MMNNSNNTHSNLRIYSFDIMRILAACAVIMLHISADYVKEFPNASFDFIVGNLLNSFSRFAVPIFLMISGALMLNENKKISEKKVFKSLLNILILIVVWSILYSVAYNIVKPLIFSEAISIDKIFSAIFDGHYHMWYLFVLAGLYLITPILRLFVKKENISLIGIYLLIAIIICFGGSFINEILNISLAENNLFFNYLEKYRMDYIFEYIIYYILGWYLLNIKFTKKKRLILYSLGIIGLIFTFIGTQIYFNPSVNADNYFYSNDSLNIFLYSVAAFALLHQIFNKSKFDIFFIRTLSKLTFGVYLIHPIFLFVFKAIFSNIRISLIAILLIFLSSSILSFIFVWIISKIPVVKKLMRN